jgi:hypothetical protein
MNRAGRNGRVELLTFRLATLRVRGAAALHHWGAHIFKLKKEKGPTVTMIVAVNKEDRDDCQPHDWRGKN